MARSAGANQEYVIMIKQIETKHIPIDAIDMGQRDQLPTEAEIEQLSISIDRGGLIQPIGVRASGDRYCLVHGATRLLAVKKLGRSEIPAVVLEGTPQEIASAELVENLDRRHLDKEKRDELTKRFVKLTAIETQKELDDNQSRNSSPQSKAHPKTKVEGAKRGRPPTPEGQAKKEVAAKTRQSVRAVQKATSNKPKGEPAHKKTQGECDTFGLVQRHIKEIRKLLSDCDHRHQEMIRKDNQPYLEGWFDTDGQLLDPAVSDDRPGAGENFESSPADQKD
jgi:ParB/RepB/Spo0J family partition protein